MGQNTLQLGNEDVSVEVTLQTLSDELGFQYIIDGDGRDFAYLAAIALECRDNESYDLTQTLMEFLRNNTTTNLSKEEGDEIEEILRRR